jgi:hypothetical protein
MSDGAGDKPNQAIPQAARYFLPESFHVGRG